MNKREIRRVSFFSSKETIEKSSVPPVLPYRAGLAHQPTTKVILAGRWVDLKKSTHALVL